VPSWLRGPRLTLVIAAALVAMVGVLLAATGWTEPGVRLVIRATARTSVALFLAAFLASTLRRRWPGPATSWLLQNRRYVGLGFAVSHLLHLLAILELYDVAPAAFADLPWVTIIVGGGGFVVVGILAATSSDAAVRMLGTQRWRNLHRFGLYYLWIVFTFTYLRTSLVMTAVLVAALVLRLRGGRGRTAVQESRG
jgi:DMSO/TMAO reductase YedYZ heme-binding membrane subunit